MADDADATQDRMEVEAALLARERKKPAMPAPTGDCFYCGDLTSDTEHFCSTDCRQAWDKENAIRKRQGLA